MLEFRVYFHDCNPLQCQINDTGLGRRYFYLLQQQVRDQPCGIFRDPQKYTMEYFMELVHRAQEILGWNWHRSEYPLDVTTALHKDLERYLARGFKEIPETHDELLHELHFALHAIESGSQRNSWLQIEWFNDRGFSMHVRDYPAKIAMDFGDIRLQNPYVGHHPLYIYQQQDTANIDQTCKFHDFVKPGINLVIDQSCNTYQFDQQDYLAWWAHNAPNFLRKHGVHTVMSWTGHPVIGRVLNLNDLEIVLKKPYLEFSHVEIY